MDKEDLTTMIEKMITELMMNLKNQEEEVTKKEKLKGLEETIEEIEEGENIEETGQKLMMIERELTKNLMKTEEVENILEDQDQELMMIKKVVTKNLTRIEEVVKEVVKEVDIEEEDTTIASQENIKIKDLQESQELNMMEKDHQKEVDTESKSSMMEKDLQNQTEELIEVMAKEEMDIEEETEEEEVIKIEELKKLKMKIKSDKFWLEFTKSN